MLATLHVVSGVKRGESGSATIPVRWARWRGVSLFIAKHVKPIQPAILILSLPRSGSSWVGEILGSATNAMYLREPINQSFLATPSGKTLFGIEPSGVPDAYKGFADMAFGGLPAFPRSIVRFPTQWNPVHRSHKRLVIKEVNPLAIDWFLQRYSPRLVFLLRHPAAVALSYERLGWSEAFVSPQDRAEASDKGLWHHYGRRQGAILRVVWDRLRSYGDFTIALYEDLCAEPLTQFRELFEFADLEWGESVETLIGQRSSYDDKKTYGTARDSERMIRAWRSDITRQELEGLKAGYRAFGLPWYEKEDEW